MTASFGSSLVLGLIASVRGVNHLNVVVPSLPAGVVPLQIDDFGNTSSNQVTIAVE